MEGQSGRNISTRFIEHVRSFKYKKQDSTYANHFLEGHAFDENLITTELHSEKKGLKLTILENLEIKRSLSNTNDTDHFNSKLMDIFYK